MNRVDRLAQWVASDILRAQGAARTPDRMAAVMPIAYTMASGFLGALGSVIGDMADELARGAGVRRRHRIPGLGELVVSLDLREWEAQLAGERPVSSDREESNQQEAV